MRQITLIFLFLTVGCLGVFDNNPDYVLEPNLQVWEDGEHYYGPEQVESILLFVVAAMEPSTDWGASSMIDWVHSGSVKISFIKEKAPCIYEGVNVLCGGWLRSDIYGNYWPHIWATECIADSAFVHEIQHMLLWRFVGWPDYSHSMPKVWDLETELTTQIRKDFCE